MNGEFCFVPGHYAVHVTDQCAGLARRIFALQWLSAIGLRKALKAKYSMCKVCAASSTP